MSEVVAATPAAEAAPAPTVEETTTVVNPNPNLNEDDQIIEQIRKEAQAARADKIEEEVPSKKEDKPVKKDKKPSVKFDTAELAVDALTKAFEAGDLDTLVKITGKPKSFFQLNDAKWATFREKENSVRKLHNEAQSSLKELNEAKNLARQEFGTALAAKEAFRNGDYGKFTTLVSELAGEDYSIVQKKVINFLNTDPGVKKANDRIKELEAQLAEKEKPPGLKVMTPEQKAEAYKNVVTEMNSECAGHPMLKVKGYENLILNRVRDSWDADENAYTLSFRDAADAVLEDRRNESEALGFSTRATQSPSKKASVPEVNLPSRGRSADARVPDGEPWLTEDMSDDDIIKSIQRDARSGKIGKK